MFLLLKVQHLPFSEFFNVQGTPTFLIFFPEKPQDKSFLTGLENFVGSVD